MKFEEPRRHQGPVLRVLQTKDETRAFYDKISGVYDLLAERSEGPSRQAGLDMVGTVAGKRVLEVGYGTGHCVAQLAEAVGPAGKGFGIDLSEGMRARARELLEKEQLIDRVELVCGDATHIPYPDDSMDVVFMSFTF